MKTRSLQQLFALFAVLCLLPGCRETPVGDNTTSSTTTVPANTVAPAPVTDKLTMFRGDAERNISGVGTVPRVPKLLWRFRTKDKLEGPYEERGDVKLTAKSVWRGCGWTGQPIMQNGKVYFGSADSYVYCLEAKTGAPVWYYPNHHVIKGSISIFNDRIYHGGRDNKIHCYNLDGKMLWETRTGNDMDSNPVVVDGKGFIGGEDSHIYSFDPDTGKIRWQSERTNGSIESSPTVVGNKVIAGSDYGTLY
ncbi:MAG: PQQ-binding-like beta-propeller repeat protein, partial [bacterium]